LGTISLKTDAKEVHQNLFIGAFPDDAHEILTEGFNFHVDCRGEHVPPKNLQVEVPRAYLPLWDDPAGPVTEDVLARVKRASKNVAGRVRAGEKCLITCFGGFNRSALVAAFTIHELTGKPGAEIVEQIREARGGPTEELSRRSCVQHLPNIRALNNHRFVAAIEALGEKTYDADVLIFDVVGGAYTKATADGGKALGGSELEVVQIAHALAGKGHKVVVSNQIASPVLIDGVQYLPHAQALGLRTKTLWVQRHSPAPVPQIDADYVCIRTTDMNEPAYKTHADILSSGQAELLCVSRWQAGQFPSAKRRCVVPSPLGEMPAVAKVPGRFVYASAPAKGLEPTLGVWMRLKANHAAEMAGTKLLVTWPNYKFGRAPEVTDEMRRADVEFVSTPSLEGYRELIASAQGVFYASCYTETACMIAAMCERAHTRFHFWPMTDAGGVPEMLTNHRLIASSQMQMEDDFLAALKEPDRAEWYATNALKDLSVPALLPIWERGLHLVDQAPDDPQAPLYIPADERSDQRLPNPFIATPAYGGMMTMPFVSSIVAMISGMQKLGMDPTLHFLGNESLITRARNNCVADFLKSNCSHLVFIDADIGFTTQHLVDMLCSGLGVVFGAYPKKSIAWAGVLLAAQTGRAKTPQDLEQYQAEFALNFHEADIQSGRFKVLERNGMAFMSVKEASTGFCCISRAAIEQMIEAYGSELAYMSDSNQGFGETRYALFDCPIVAEGESDAPLIALRKAAKALSATNGSNGTEPRVEAVARLCDAATKFSESVAKTKCRYLSEDYGFSRRWASLGGETYVYVGANLTHTGTYTYSGNFRMLFDGADEPATTHVEP
jgi:hypothetical protein